jgi:hypothetical protein
LWATQIPAGPLLEAGNDMARNPAVERRGLPDVDPAREAA